MEINVRELKAHASDILRNVSKRRRRYVVTCRGRRVALIVPVQEAEDRASSEIAWADFRRLSGELSSRWRAGADAIGLVSSMRR